MKVANVIEEGKLGGPQIRMVRVAAALKGRVETVIVLPKANSAPFQAMCEAEGVPYRVRALTRITKTLSVALGYVLFSPWEVYRLALLFKQEKIDVVHASGGSWQYKAVLAARLARIPSVWHLNDTHMPGWVQRLFRLVAPATNGFIFASERSRAYSGQFLKDDTRPQMIVPSTVDRAAFDPNHPAAAKDKDLWPGETIIGTVANVNPVKGLERFIRALAQLEKAGHTVRGIVVGPVHDNQSAYFETLEKLAADLGVTRLDWVGSRKDVRPMLGRFDVYVCSSVAESSPVSVWEAMSMACPVVSTDVGDVARHIHHGENGFIADGEDKTALGDRIADMLADPAKAAEMGGKARDTVVAFSPETIAQLTLDAYEAVTKAETA